MNAPTVRIVTDSRNRKDNKLALRYYIFYQGKQVYIPLKVFLTSEEWDFISNRANSKGRKGIISNDDFAKYRSRISFLENRMESVILKFQKLRLPFTAEDIKKEFLDAPIDSKSICLLKLFDELIALKVSANRPLGTIEGYRTAKESFRKYLNSTIGENKADTFPITSVNAKWIQAFQLERRSINSETTINDYIITLRAVFNHAIQKDLVDSSLYPFKRKNDGDFYKIQKSAKTKRALTKEEFDKLKNSRSKLSIAQQEAWDYFMISFLLNGANLIDIALLRYSNIDEFTNTIKFLRQKTSQSIDDKNEIVVSMSDVLTKLIEIRGNKRESNQTFIFPILNESYKTDNQKREQVSKKLHLFGKRWDRIALIADVRSDLTFQFARHTYAVLAVQNNVPIEEISRSMGHSDIQMTKSYLASLPSEATPLNDLMKSNLLKVDNLIDI